MEDIRQTKAWGKYLVDKGWKTDVVKAADGIHSMNVFIVSLGMFGLTMLKLQRSEYDPDWKDLRRTKKKHWVVSSIIEPTRIQDTLAYTMAGYRLTRMPYLAMKTYIVDLTQSEEQLWKNLSDNAKRMITKNKDVVVEETDADTFLANWRKWSKIWIMKPAEISSLKKHFGKNVSLIVSRDGDVYHSGLLLIKTRDMANYYQTWTSESGRLSGAHYKLVWTEMLKAKKEGLKYFDLEGIFDERWPQKRWLGFTEFKRRFGGKLITFPGSFFRWL